MKRHLLSISAALLVSSFTFTSCIDNKESASVTNIRDAKAEQLKSLAGMYKAQGDAELIRANFEKAYQDALTAMQLLDNEEKSLANDQLKAAQLIKIEAAIAQANAALAEALKNQAEKEAELRVESDKVFSVALTNYNNAYLALYGDGGSVLDLNAAQVSLIELKSDLVKIERWVADELVRLETNLVGRKEAVKIYTAADANSTFEQRQANVDAASILRDELVEKSAIAGEFLAEKKAVSSDKESYIKLGNDVVTINGTTYSYRCNFTDYEAMGAYKRTEFLTVGDRSLMREVLISHNPVYEETVVGMVDPSFEYFLTQYMNGANLKTSPYVLAALSNAEFFMPSKMVIPSKIYTLDAGNSISTKIGGKEFVKFKLINADGYKAAIDDMKSVVSKAEAAKTAAIAAYTAAVNKTAAAKLEWENAAAAAKPAKETAYFAAKQQSNIACLEKDFAISNIDGGVIFCSINLMSNRPANPNEVSSKTSLDITHETAEGVYNKEVTIEVTEIDAATNTASIFNYTYTVRNTSIPYMGLKAEYEAEKSFYDWVINPANAAEYEKRIADYKAAYEVEIEAEFNKQLAVYNLNVANSKLTTYNNLLNDATDYKSMIEEENRSIEDIEARIANIKNITAQNDLGTFIGTANAKEQAIAYKNAEIAKLQTEVSLGEVILKNCKAAIDALMK